MKLDSKQLRDLILQETKKILREENNKVEPKVEFPAWLGEKLKTTHGEPGQGSVFSSPETVKDVVMKLVEREVDKIDSIAKGPGTLTARVPGIGYDLVLPMDDASDLPDADVGETEKVEGPNKVKVPMVKTSAPIDKFSTDQLTVIVRPKKNESGSVIPGEYIILSAFPGKDLPRASEWGGKYAIVVPDSGHGKKTESAFKSKEVLIERWLRLAGLVK